MIDKPIYLHLTHATGNNITKRKRAGEVSARAGKSCAMSSARFCHWNGARRPAGPSISLSISSLGVGSSPRAYRRRMRWVESR